jgi:tungstate transport system ATP-binding protein
MFQLDAITQRYGARTVLSIDKLDIPEGDRVGVIGPSGAGKSTLLRLLALLESPSGGTLRYNGSQIADPVPIAIRREITLVFQRPLLLDTTVRRNLGYGLHLRGVRDNARIAELIELLGLQQVADARARTLSGGEMQRVALGRALAIRPRVLLLDEPTANLDPHNVALMERAILAQHEAHGTTVVIATHNLHQTRRMTNRAMVLLDGQLIEIGKTERLLDDPQDTRTKAFVEGAMVY